MGYIVVSISHLGIAHNPSIRACLPGTWDPGGRRHPRHPRRTTRVPRPCGEPEFPQTHCTVCSPHRLGAPNSFRPHFGPAYFLDLGLPGAVFGLTLMILAWLLLTFPGTLRKLRGPSSCLKKSLGSLLVFRSVWWSRFLFALVERK